MSINTEAENHERNSEEPPYPLYTTVSRLLIITSKLHALSDLIIN